MDTSKIEEEINVNRMILYKILTEKFNMPKKKAIEFMEESRKEAKRLQKKKQSK